MIQIQDLTLAYGHHLVLEKINIHVEAGEVLAIVGPNGIGKTTLLNAISGITPSAQGKIKISGGDISTLRYRERARLMAVVPQARSLPSGYSVWQTVMMGRTPYLGWLGKPLPADNQHVKTAIELVGINDLSERPIEDLSGGEQQRVLLARAIAQNTPILLLDEPTAHLDIRNQASFLSLVLKLVKQNEITVLISIHNLNLAAQVADRIALLSNHRLQSIGNPKQVLTEDNLVSAYNTPIEINQHPTNNRPVISIDLKKE